MFRLAKGWIELVSEVDFFAKDVRRKGPFRFLLRYSRIDAWIKTERIPKLDYVKFLLRLANGWIKWIELVSEVDFFAKDIRRK